jgi:hypothetical protein
MAITKATASSIAPAAKGDLVAGSATNDAAVLTVGANDTVLTADSSTATGLKWAAASSGSTNITLKRVRDTSTATFISIATDGSSKYVIVGSSGVLYSSTDSGVTWTSRTSGFGSSTIRRVTYANAIFVAVGDSGLITTSTDAITWTARTSGFGSSPINGIDYVNGYFIATGRDTPNSRSGVSTSTDGITWTFRTTPAGSAIPARCATYGNGYYVVAGDGNTTAAMYSTDLVTWTAITATNGYAFVKAFFENSQFILFTDTANGENWFTGNNPSTGWNYFYPSFVTAGTRNTNSIDSYSGNVFDYSSTTPQFTIAKAKLQIAVGTGLSPTEIYKPYTKDLPTTLVAIVSKGDGTFALLNSQGYVWFTS